MRTSTWAATATLVGLGGALIGSLQVGPIADLLGRHADLRAQFDVDAVIAADQTADPGQASVRWDDGRPTHVAWQPDTHCLWAELDGTGTITLVSGPAGDQPCTADGAHQHLHD